MTKQKNHKTRKTSKKPENKQKNNNKKRKRNKTNRTQPKQTKQTENIETKWNKTNCTVAVFYRTSPPCITGREKAQPVELSPSYRIRQASPESWLRYSTGRSNRWYCLPSGLDHPLQDCRVADCLKIMVTALLSLSPDIFECHNF